MYVSYMQTQKHVLGALAGRQRVPRQPQAAAVPLTVPPSRGWPCLAKFGQVCSPDPVAWAFWKKLGGNHSSPPSCAEEVGSIGMKHLTRATQR